MVKVGLRREDVEESPWVWGRVFDGDSLGSKGLCLFGLSTSGISCCVSTSAPVGDIIGGQATSLATAPDVTYGFEVYRLPPHMKMDRI